MVGDRTVPSTPERGAKNVQGDLFTGEWHAKPPKRGNGSHIQLKPLDDEKAIVPGMASYAGEGPAGTYCRDCAQFGVVAVQTGVDDVEINRTGCVLYAQRMGHAAPAPRRDIRLCAACKHFAAADEAAPRVFVVDHAGAICRIQNLPEDLKRWRPKVDDISITPPAEGDRDDHQHAGCASVGLMEKQ
jgi:hypothetical protein